MKYTSKGWLGLPPMSPGFQQSLDRQFVKEEIKKLNAKGEDASWLIAKLAKMPGVD